MKTILDIMRVDLITANGKKHSFTRFLIMSAVIAVLIGLLLSPLMQFVLLLVFAGMIVSSLYQAATKSDAEQIFSILPVGRKQIVLARFLLAAGLFSAMSLLCAVVTLISTKLKLYVSIWGVDLGEVLDVLRDVTEIKNSEAGMYLMVLCAAFWIGMMILPRSVRRYLKSSGRIADGKRMFGGAKKFFLIVGMVDGIAVLITVLWNLGARSALLGTLLRLFMQLLIAMGQVGDGKMLCLLMIAAGIGAAVYQYICTVLEYDEKEL